MRVFLSSLIFLVLVGCNTSTDELVIEETKVEFEVDSVTLMEEELMGVEIDKTLNEIKKEEKEDVKDLEVNSVNDRISFEEEYRIEDERMKLISILKKGEAIRIHFDTLAYFGFSFENEDGDGWYLYGCLFTGVVFQTFDNGVIKRETDYEKGKKLSHRKYYQNGQICKSSEIIAFINGPFNIGKYPPFGWDTYVELSNDLFFYQTGEKKGKYLNCHVGINDGYDGCLKGLREGKSWNKNGNLARQLDIKDESMKDLKIDEVIEKIFIEEKWETIKKCFDEKGNEIDCRI